MGTHPTTQTVVFPDLFRKPIEAKFDQRQSSSDGGALLLKSIDADLGLTETLANALVDRRESAKTRHSVHDLLRQRVYGIALGYPDGNDAHALRNDPILKLTLDRDPARGRALGSQSTLSRFENAARRTDLYRLADALADFVIERHRRRLQARCRLITLDFDPTHDPTHGQQEFAFYHGFYDTHCYLPLVGTVCFNDEADQSLICALLRPGNAGAALGLIGVLERLIPKLRRSFPRARIRVRLDGAFGIPTVLDYLDEVGVEYVAGLATTKALKSRAKRATSRARRLLRQTGRTAQVFGDTLYKTKTTWPHRRRVVYKAEVVLFPGREPRDNVRFVVTNLKQTPKKVYRIYTARGDAENRIKELKGDLDMDRTSCHRFAANQLRVLMTAAAYVLMEELRRRARHTDCRRAQVAILRTRLLKIAAWVEVSVRRVVVHLPQDFPGRHAWSRIAERSGAIAC